MPISAMSRRLRRLRRHFGIAAPKVVVRSQWSLQRAFTVLALFAALGMFTFWLAAPRFGAPLAGSEYAALRKQLDDYHQENLQLRAQASGGESALAIERAAQLQLLQKLELLEKENAALKEDLRFFERLLSASDNGGTLRIEGFSVTAESALRYRYRMFIVFNADKQNPDFRGRLQLTVNYVHEGKESQLVLPAHVSSGSEYLLNIRRFSRREGGFELPEGGQLKGVEARILQGDIVRVQKNAKI